MMIQGLQRCRLAEKEQALFYRSLAFLAEEIGDAALSERLHGLHADEQHHLSRLTARLVEVGAAPDDVNRARAESVLLESWEVVARRREQEEIRRYEDLLAGEIDEQTTDLIAAILDAERHHAEELGGKWTAA